jgi:hypothetical protein
MSEKLGIAVQLSGWHKQLRSSRQRLKAQQEKGGLFKFLTITDGNFCFHILGICGAIILKTRVFSFA